MEEPITNDESANMTSPSDRTDQSQQQNERREEQDLQEAQLEHEPMLQQDQEPMQQKDHEHTQQQHPEPMLQPDKQEQHQDQQQQQQQQQHQQQQHEQEQQQQQPQAHPQQQGNILEAIKDFDSSIPDAVVHHFLNVAGMQTSDQRIIRLIAIAAQKFIHDIVSDSLQHCKLRSAQNKKAKERKYTLSIDDLTSALAEYGIEIKRQPYFN